MICASLVRQFEFAQNVWVNDPNFHELGNERDPIIGNQDGTFDSTIPKRPIRRKITGLPAFTTVGAAPTSSFPALKALSWLADLGPSTDRRRVSYDVFCPASRILGGAECLIMVRDQGRSPVPRSTSPMSLRFRVPSVPVISCW